MDESTDPSNSFNNDVVVHTKRDDVPNPATDAQGVTKTYNDQQIKVVGDVPIEEGVEETQGQPSNSRQTFRYMISHPADLIISYPTGGVCTRSSSSNTFFAFNAFISQVKPNNIKEALLEVDWICAMQDELMQFERNKVWRLVPRPNDRTVIGTR